MTEVAEVDDSLYWKIHTLGGSLFGEQSDVSLDHWGGNAKGTAG